MQYAVHKHTRDATPVGTAATSNTATWKTCEQRRAGREGERGASGQVYGGLRGVYIRSHPPAPSSLNFGKRAPCLTSPSPFPSAVPRRDLDLRSRTSLLRWPPRRPPVAPLSRDLRDSTWVYRRVPQHPRPHPQRVLASFLLASCLTGRGRAGRTIYRSFVKTPLSAARQKLHSIHPYNPFGRAGIAIRRWRASRSCRIWASGGESETDGRSRGNHR